MNKVGSSRMSTGSTAKGHPYIEHDVNQKNKQTKTPKNQRTCPQIFRLKWKAWPYNE